MIYMNKEILKDFLIKEIFKHIYENIFSYYDTIPSHLENEYDLNDWMLDVKIGDIKVEEYDMIYWIMYNTIKIYKNEMINAINNLIDKKCIRFYGDPAFSSARDYWEYKLG